MKNNKVQMDYCFTLSSRLSGSEWGDNLSQSSLLGVEEQFPKYPFATPPPYKKGFTLAETLITLVIVGVIAAITVPSLINKIQNQETVSKLKKAYSTLAQATNQIIAEEGPVRSWLSTQDDLYGKYKKQLNNVKVCGSQNGCFNQRTVTYLSNATTNWDIGQFNKFILQDGTQIIFGATTNYCNLTNNVSEGSKNYCAIIWADLNGEKKPNTLGRDIFAFVLKNNGLYPAGCDIEGYCTINAVGSACACKVLREGAINY